MAVRTHLQLSDGRVLGTTADVATARRLLRRGGRIGIPVPAGLVFLSAREVVDVRAAAVALAA